MEESNAKHQRGDLLIYNPSGKFGNKEDRLFHVHSIRYGTCTNIPKKQFWYSGYQLELGEYDSEGVPIVPVFSTTTINVREKSLKELDHLSLTDFPN